MVLLAELIGALNTLRKKQEREREELNNRHAEEMRYHLQFLEILGEQQRREARGEERAEEPQRQENLEAQEDGEERANDDSEKVVEFEPQVAFGPVVALPDLIEVCTGEENEEVLFEEQCTLYRFDVATKTWKERGEGKIRVLKNPQTNTFRVIMRRDQVLSLCTNFRFVDGMKSERLGNAVFWICSEYLDGSHSSERLAARFQAEPMARMFKAAFENIVGGLKEMASRVRQSRKRKIELPPAAQNNTRSNGGGKHVKKEGETVVKTEPPESSDESQVSGPSTSSGAPGTSGARPVIGTFKIPHTSTRRKGPSAKTGQPSSSKESRASGASATSGAPGTSGASSGAIDEKPFVSKPSVPKDPNCTVYSYDAAWKSHSIFGGLTAALRRDSSIAPPSFLKPNAPATSSAVNFNFRSSSGSSHPDVKPLSGNGYGESNPTLVKTSEVRDDDVRKLVEQVTAVTSGGRRYEGQEEILFAENCSMTRFVYQKTFSFGITREMQNLGSGDLRILKHTTTDTYRLSMPRTTVASIDIILGGSVEFTQIRCGNRDVLLKFYELVDGEKNEEMLTFVFNSEPFAQRFVKILKEAVAPGKM